MNYIASIVGRSNVGKSTLFNRLVGQRQAVVHEQEGITRDRIYGSSDWNGVSFTIIDTGGLPTKETNLLEKEIKHQISLAINESYVILFVVDAQIGLLNADIKMASLLRKCHRIILLVLNKVDNDKYLYKKDIDFFHLGFSKYYYVSALNGRGTGDLLDDLIKLFQKKKLVKQKPQDPSRFPKFTIVGRPNVGKSTLINSLLENNQHIVTNFAGTTRDSLHVLYEKLDHTCMLFDTPGLRKRSKIKENIEFYSSIRTFQTIEYTDVCLLMIDAMRGWEKQDMILFRLVEKYQKCMMILINKWDLFTNKEISIRKNFELFIRKKIHPFYNVPIFFISAKNRHGIQDIIPMAYHLIELRKNKLKTNTLNKIMLPIVKKHPPSSKKKLITIKYCTQIPSCITPKFIFFSNFPNHINKSYKRFIENKIRDHFDFSGVPIQIFFRKK
ncbi:ribosome biogenesis GTPase Der [Blattabacterium cuenoti]|uniref:ribosome biogenesis GTPase Der n=1 Tax=Blattabacterium cuenoti TaxID=1653831 RepID=UPI00163D08D3|nr:ribosome biogenesis GTPase Der [Blattabacterium cuenoti]